MAMAFKEEYAIYNYKGIKMQTHNLKKHLEVPEQVVHYYNLYKLDNKDNKDNKYAEETSADIENTCGSLRSGLASLSASQDIPIQVGQVVSGDNIPDEVLPILNEDMISRAVIQFFDNEGQKQRYKVKIRFNLVDKENPEFIATLTKDWSNFKKYIPAECRDDIINKATHIRSTIKAQHGVYPYLGKFHLANSWNKGRRQPNEIEPNTLAAIWWDSEEKGWSGVVCIHDWIYEFDLFEENLTAKQKTSGCKAATLYINPKHDKRVRPKTWAQRRSEAAK
jgi:hypothetical protein